MKKAFLVPAIILMTAISKAAEPKELYWVKGASHIDLYDKDEYLPEVVTKLVNFFGKNL